jgi:tetratricopeptide (TPR) repeat protein
VLKNEEHELSAQAAMSRYLTFAQEQLAAALGDVPQGSGALFGLGKIYSFPAEAHGPPDSTGGAKAVAFYQASLMVDGRNFMAANELGVMLVSFGRLNEARSAFQHSLKVSSQPVVWENLATVHRSLGENELAQKAQKAAAYAATQKANGAAAMTAYDVQWVDPATFARSKPIDADPIKPTPMSPASPTAETPKSVAGSVGFGVSSRK